VAQSLLHNCRGSVVAHALVRAASRLISTPGARWIRLQVSTRVSIRHAGPRRMHKPQVRAPHSGRDAPHDSWRKYTAVMRRISFVLATIFFSCLAGSLSAQEVSPTAPNIKQAAMPNFGTIFPARPRQAARPALVNAAPALTAKAIPAGPARVLVAPESGKCSVQLNEMQIPRDLDFSIGKQVPNADALAPMPKATLPAPSCADGSSAR